MIEGTGTCKRWRLFVWISLILLSGGIHAREVTLVTVYKSERILQLHAGPEVLREYPISLGDAPEGHKIREGDQRTPEGRYVLDWRNPDSKYYRSIRISYPDNDDLVQAEARGHPPGGDIFIHGLPNGMELLAPTFRGRDWTDGCIGINSNDDMREIWDLVQDGTYIMIYP